MEWQDFFYIFFFSVVLFSLAYPLGLFMARVWEGNLPKRVSWMHPLEKFIYKFSGIDPKKESTAAGYFMDLIVFNLFGIILLFSLLIFQARLPLNPEGIPGLDPFLAINTAISFVTNTNWQAYSGETSLSYFSQMAGLSVQNFLSAATGGAIIMVLVRGLRRKLSKTVGNFWVDMIRFKLYVLLPLSFIFALVLVSQGVIQNLEPYLMATSLEGDSQTLPMGPVASQIAIKQLGTNGGGFFGMNSTHPFENPTPFSNFLQLLAILLIPVAQIFAFGRLIREERQIISILSVMGFLLIVLLGISLWGEYALPSWEGKEFRFGQTESVLWSVVTTAASNGGVNAMHSSLSPLSILVALFNMMTGEVIFGGVGSGFYGIFLYVILTVFMAGLMIGRGPEYLGKKIESKEVKLALLGVLLPSALILIGSGAGIISDWGLQSLSSQGPHGLSEILYAFTSAAANNGSALAGFNGNTPVLNLSLGLCMFLGRFIVIYAVLMICGELAAKKTTPASAGTFPTDSYLFSLLLLGTIILVGALTFFPALALGPLAEHFLLLQGQNF